MKNIINKIYNKLKQEGFVILIKDSVKHVKKQLLMNVISILALNRKELLSKCEQNDSIIYVKNEEYVTIEAPTMSDPPEEFEKEVGLHEPGPSFVCELSDVSVIGPYGICVTSKGRPIIEPMGNERILLKRIQKTITYLGLKKSVYYYLNSFLQKSEKSEGQISVHLIPRHSEEVDKTNYSHWVGEDLPKLRGIESYIETTSQKPNLIIENNPPSFVIESLDMLGFSNDNITSWSNEYKKFNKIIIPKLSYRHSFDVELDPKGRKWVRKQMQANLENTESSSGNKCVFISRQGADRRKIINFDQIKTCLQSHGVEIILPEELTMEEEVKLFSTTETIIGPVGANLAGYIFSEDATIIAIHPEEAIVTDFYIVAQELDLNYEVIRGETLNEDTRELDRHKDILVDKEKMEDFLYQHDCI